MGQNMSGFILGLWVSTLCFFSCSSQEKGSGFVGRNDAIKIATPTLQSHADQVENPIDHTTLGSATASPTPTPLATPIPAEDGGIGSLNLPPISCVLSSAVDEIPAGSEINLIFSLSGPVDEVVFAGTKYPTSQKEFTVSPTENTTYQVTISNKKESKVCEKMIKVEGVQTTAFRSDKALCEKGAGIGRNLLVIADYTGENFPAYLKADFEEIKGLTGITTTLSVINDNNSPPLSSLISDKKFDAVWYFSSLGSLTFPISNNGLGGGITLPLSPTRSADIASILQQLYKTGTGIGIFGDNDPATGGANTILTSGFSDWNILLTGDYLGTRFVGKPGYPSDGSGLLFEHSITSGLYQNIFEGVTIAEIVPYNSGKQSVRDLKIFSKILQNTGGNITIGAIEEGIANQATARANAFKKNGISQSRAIIHGAFTQFYRSGESWFDAAWPLNTPSATRQFVANMACWSVGVK